MINHLKYPFATSEYYSENERFVLLQPKMNKVVPTLLY